METRPYDGVLAGAPAFEGAPAPAAAMSSSTTGRARAVGGDARCQEYRLQVSGGAAVGREWWPEAAREQRVARQQEVGRLRQ